ncbi:MAG: helix-turn-helix domain-containing protein [Vicinamibacterales bacterium]
MQYAEHPVHRALAPYVRVIWSFDWNAAPTAVAPERVMPDGVVELIFHYRTPFSMQLGDGPATRQPTSFALLQGRRFIEITPAGPSGFVAVRFQPWGARHFLDLPLSELADREVPAGEIWGRAASTLEARLAEASDASRGSTLVQDFLLERFEAASELAEHVTRAMWTTGGAIRPKELAGRLGITERHLERLCNRDLGMPPKQVARLARFLRACSAIRRSRHGLLTGVAQACGYYDQSHFIGDFREFAGMTPGAFARDRSVSALDLEQGA